MKLVYSTFFVVEPGLATQYYTLEAIEAGYCKDPDEFIKRIKSRRLTFKLDRGGACGDLAIGSWVTLFFSERFVTLLKKNNIKFNAYPLKFQKGVQIPIRYYYVEPKEKPVSIINKKGTVRWFTDSQGDRSIMARKGLYLKLKEWAGSDFFMVKNSRIYIVTKRLKEAIEKAKLKNAKFENVLEWSFGEL